MGARAVAGRGDAGAVEAVLRRIVLHPPERHAAFLDHRINRGIRREGVVDHGECNAPACKAPRHDGGLLVAQLLPVTAMDEEMDRCRRTRFGQKEVEHLRVARAIGGILDHAAGTARLCAF